MAVFLFILFGILAVVGAFIGTWLIGLIWGGLLKLGVFGRILTTLITALPLVIVIYLLTNVGNVVFDIINGGGSFWGLAIITFIFGLTLLLPVWYFFWHYYAVESMGAVEFGATLRIPILLFFAGLALVSLLGMFIKELAYVCFPAGIIIGNVIYFAKTKEYSCPEPKEAVIRWVAIAAVVVVTVVVGFKLPSITANVEAQDKKSTDSFLEAFKDASTQNVNVVVTDKNAFILGFPSSTNTDFIEPHPNKGDVLTVTGEAVIEKNGDIWLPIVREGVKGFIRKKYVKIQK